MRSMRLGSDMVRVPLGGVQGWASDEKSVFGQGLGPKVGKKWTYFFKSYG